MHVYSLWPDLDHFQTLTCPRKARRQFGTDVWRAAPLASSWKPIQMAVYVDEDAAPRKRPLPLPDFTAFLTIPVFFDRALAVLGDLLTPAGELLPLLAKGFGVAAFHLTCFVDALHPECRVARAVRAGGIVAPWDDTEYVFLPELVRERHVFGLPDAGWYGAHFVSDTFVRRVVESELRGFDFHLLWSEPGSEPPPEIPRPLRPKPPRPYRPRLAPALGLDAENMTGREPMLAEASRAKPKRKRTK